LTSPLTDGRLTGLHLHHCALPPETLSRLMHWGGLKNVTALDLSGSALHPDVIRALATSPVLGKLTDVSVAGEQAAPEGLLALSRVTGLKRLRKLHLERPIDAEAEQALRQRFGPRLSVGD
jgi:hypothetical protein